MIDIKYTVDDIHKISLLLEENIGKPKPILDPLTGYSLDEAANIILAHIGFTPDHKIPIIIQPLGYTISGKFVCNHSTGDIPKIYIDDKLTHDGMLEVLCHELTHYYMFYHGMMHNFYIDDEIMTDYAAIYLGLGKMLLNGYYGSKTSSTMYLGYVNRWYRTIMYILVCNMNNVDSGARVSHLLPECLSEINTVSNCCGKYIDDSYYEETRFMNSIKNKFGEVVWKCNKLFS